jgi:hypothetical protein
MTTETTSNKITLVSRFVTLVTALQGLPDTELAMGGKTFAKSAVIGILSAYVTANQTASADKQKWRKSVTDEKAAVVAARSTRALVKTFLQGRLGKTSPELTRYGFEPAKTPKKSVKAKATGIDKSQATRKARNTMGSKQKKAIKGAPPATAPAQSAGAPPAPKPTAT